MPPVETTPPKPPRKSKPIKALASVPIANANRISVERMFEPDASGQTPVGRRALDPSPWASNYLASCVQDLPKNKLEEFACLIFLRIANDIVTPSTAQAQRVQHNKILDDVLRSLHGYADELNYKSAGAGEDAHKNLLNFARDAYFGHFENGNHSANEMHVFSGRITALKPEAQSFTRLALSKIESRGITPPSQPIKESQPPVTTVAAATPPAPTPAPPAVLESLKAASKQTTQWKTTIASARNSIAEVAAEFRDLAAFIGHRQAVKWRWVWRGINRTIPKPRIRFKNKL